MVKINNMSMWIWDYDMYVRKNKKACLYDKERENFRFDYKEEKAIYKFQAGLKLNTDEEVRLENQYNTYADWKNYIKRKYKELDAFTLKEFRRHLIQRKRNKKTGGNISAIFSSALISSLITYFIGLLIDVQQLANNDASFYIKCIGIFAVEIILVIAVAFVLYKIIDSFYHDNEETIFIDDYIEILEKMIEQKEKAEYRKKKKKKSKK